MLIIITHGPCCYIWGLILLIGANFHIFGEALYLGPSLGQAKFGRAKFSSGQAWTGPGLSGAKFVGAELWPFHVWTIYMIPMPIIVISSICLHYQASRYIIRHMMNLFYKFNFSSMEIYKWIYVATWQARIYVSTSSIQTENECNDATQGILSQKLWAFFNKIIEKIQLCLFVC